MIVRQDKGFVNFYKIVAIKFMIPYKNYPVNEGGFLSL